MFNYRLCRAQQSIECAFGILAARFCIYQGPLEVSLETVDLLVQATSVLHNYLQGDLSYEEDISYLDARDFDDVVDQLTDLPPNTRRGRKQDKHMQKILYVLHLSMRICTLAN